MSDTNNKFKIGLCMAGAISAGAYTAGAIDYLIEALDEWQKRKDTKQANTPNHDVEISVIGGASAGGMTAIITASAIQDTMDPVTKLESDIMASRPNNKLYHSWVDYTNDEMIQLLLDTSDISKEGLQSALNSDFIAKIADRALNVSDELVVPRKYIADNLKVFVTLSNLEGMDFNVAFRSISPKLDRYIINSHNDYACFKICNTEKDYTNDGWIPLNFKTKLNVDIAKQAAMATGAFPVALKAIKLSRSIKYLNDLNWFKYITKDAQHPFTKQPYKTVNVDGGMINNEPFDKIRELLIAETNQSDHNDIQNYDKFKSTVLMIDPFPSEVGEFKSSTDMMTIVGNTLGAIIDQARVKSSALIDAMDSNKAGQYLISPVRDEKNGEPGMSIEGKRAIACGSLYGFGGLISKEFRIHDYFLGRANCELFLRDYFTVPVNTINEIFVNGYSGITDKTPFISKINGGLQIIPIFTERQSESYMPTFSNKKDWPSVSYGDIHSYRRMLKKRVQKIVLNIADYTLIERVLLWIGGKVVLNGKLADIVLKKVIKSLEEHKLIK